MGGGGDWGGGGGSVGHCVLEVQSICTSFSMQSPTWEWDVGEGGGGNLGVGVGGALPSSTFPPPMWASAWKRKRIEIDLTRYNFPKVLIVFVV